MINVWATWCVPCRKELPEIQKLYVSLKTRGDIQVLTFNTDEETGRVLPFVEAADYTFPVLLARDFLTTANLSDQIPQTWIIDSHGRAVAVRLGYAAGPQWLEQLIARVEEVTRSHE